MASRRMFSHAVLTTDVFQKMSRDSQFLYIHLGMHADDDGFLGSPVMLSKMIGCEKKQLEELKQHGYLIFFPSGVCVMTHWKVNNRIQKDRYHPTVYQQEMAHLTTDETGAYVYRKTPCSPKKEAKAEAQAENAGCGLGTYKNVVLSPEELQKLKAEFSDADAMIENLSAKLAIHGYAYKNHYAVLRQWAQADKSRGQPKQAQEENEYAKVVQERQERAWEQMKQKKAASGNGRNAQGGNKETA